MDRQCCDRCRRGATNCNVQTMPRQRRLPRRDRRSLLQRAACLVRKAVEARVTRHTIEILYVANGALHARNTRKGSHSTVKEHMPVPTARTSNGRPPAAQLAASIGPTSPSSSNTSSPTRAIPRWLSRLPGLLSLAKKYRSGSKPLALAPSPLARSRVSLGLHP
ncbi:protein of unknown function (plasmid) [Cupriavidus taiwanensis]|nr:protein of unknown function [Cupriavidus taiwanensis]